MAYSIDLRKKVVDYLGRGNSQRAAQKLFHISLSTINKWSQQYKQTGKLEDKKPSRKAKKLDPERLRTYVADHPDSYQHEIAKVFECSETAVRCALKRLGITRKKRQSGIPSKSRQK